MSPACDARDLNMVLASERGSSIAPESQIQMNFTHYCYRFSDSTTTRSREMFRSLCYVQAVAENRAKVSWVQDGCGLVLRVVAPASGWRWCRHSEECDLLSMKMDRYKAKTRSRRWCQLLACCADDHCCETTFGAATWDCFTIVLSKWSPLGCRAARPGLWPAIKLRHATLATSSVLSIP